MQSIYTDDARVGEITRGLLARGETVFQIHRLAPTEEEHVAKLMEFFVPPMCATVLDLGCGVGAVAKMMSALRPDLQFILQNVSKAQLSLCPLEFAQVHCDYTTLPDMQVDAVMIQYALGHVESPETVFHGVAKVLKPGGTLFVYDLMSDGDASRLRDVLWYNAWLPEMVKLAAHDAGLVLTDARRPSPVFVEHVFNKISEAVFLEVFDDVYPMLLKFVKAA